MITLILGSFAIMMVISLGILATDEICKTIKESNKRQQQRAELKAIKLKLSETHPINKKLKIAVIVLSVVIVLCVALIAVYNVALNDVYQQLEETRAELNIANEKIKQCEQEKKQLEEKITIKEDRINVLENDVEFYKKENSELEQQLEEKENEQSNVTITEEDLEEYVEEYENEPAFESERSNCPRCGRYSYVEIYSNITFRYSAYCTDCHYEID